MKLYFGIDENSEFLKKVEEFIYNWDLSIINNLDLNAFYIEKWDLIQSALKEITGINFFFTRTDNYYGVCTENGEFLIKANRHKILRRV